MRLNYTISRVFTHLALLCLPLFIAKSVQAQCSSYSISASDSQICLNQIVTFKASNIPALSQYVWYLGLDTIKGIDKDTVSTGYFKLGSFNIRLFIKLKNGDTCSVVKPKFIKVGSAPPKPSISANNLSLCDINQTLKLKTSAKGMAKYTWNIGQVLYKDSLTSVTHKFIRTGFFDVGLKIEDAFGCETTVLYDSMILVERKPQINLGVGDTSFCDSHTVFLQPTYRMYAQKGFSFDWSFVGSTTTRSSQKKPGKIFYNKRGIYTFSLNILSAGNCKYSYTFPDTLHIGKAVNLAHTKTSTAPCNEQTFVLNPIYASSFLAELEWKFQGDSITKNTSNTQATVTYKRVGNFKYTITHNDLGCVSQYSGINNATLRTLKAQFSIKNNCSCKPQDTFLVNNNSQGITTTTVYKWLVTDAKDNVVFSSNKATPQIIINGYGIYGVQLYINDTSGCRDSLYKYGAIRVEEPKLAIMVQPKVACVGSDLTFGVDSICELDFIKAEWKFYDDENNLAGTSSDQYPIMNFSKEGKYRVELSYKTKNCSDHIIRRNVFEVVKLQSINYQLSDTTPCEGSVINASLKVLPDNIKPKVEWTIAHVSKPMVIFKASQVLGQENEYLIKPNSSGIYNMKIVVIGGKGCRDSLEVKSLIKVSGIKADFKADDIIGCLPFKTSLRSIVSKNEHYDYPSDNTLKYAWQVVPAKNVILSKPTSSSTDINITKTGNYNVFLSVSNSDGCAAIVQKQDLFTFDFEALYSIDSVTCQNITIQPTNNTPGTDIGFQWYCNSVDAVFHTKKNSKQPIISFSKPGTYRLGMVASTKSGCKDSIEKTIVVHPFSFDFSVLNNVPKCSPAQYIFAIKSTNVDTFSWRFGDGKGVVTDQKSIAHIYDLSQVKPFRNNFNVSLIAQNNVGCIDTLRYDNLVKVLGPNPTFSIKVNEGCNPTDVVFIDSTKQVSRFFFNYGDGSSVDSVGFKSHRYIIRDTNRVFEVFKPYIIASDKNNCFVYYQPNDSITVYANPIARFWTKDRTVCAPNTVIFKNNSKFAVASFWDYNHNGIFNDTTQHGKKTYKAGIYSVSLIVKNKLGCIDTITRMRYLKAFEKPLALYNQSDTILCPKRPIQFEDQTNAAYPLVSWKWTFEGMGIKDSIYGQNQIRSFKDTGFYTVTLEVTDINGCVDTIEKYKRFHIVNRLPIKSPILYYTTVQNNNSVNLLWNKLDAIGYKELQIIKDDDFAKPVKRITSYKTVNISLPETEITTKPVQYQLRLIDRCEDPNRLSTRHRTIYLTAHRNERPFAILNWTKYRGWDKIDDYVVYRSETGFDYKEIARTGKNDTTFTDFTVCNQSYFYLIGSVNPVSGNITYSNVVEYNPYYDSPKDIVEVALVTVKEQGKLLVKWSNNENLNVKNYFVDRHDDFSGWKKAYYITNDTFFIDKNVETHRLSYKYRVWYRDFCNNRNPPSNEGVSILLLGQISDKDFIYTWNGYEQWPQGVEAYVIEKTQDLKKPFVEVAILGNEARKMIDNKKAIRSDSSFYVRVKAIRKGNIPDTSYSNIIKVFPEPVIYIPNAFSPNNDNVNDVLSFNGIGFQRDEFAELEFRIYNRWGQRVFETYNYGDFWDGTYENQECLEGIYAYYIQLRGVNNTIYSYSGSVLLIR